MEPFTRRSKYDWEVYIGKETFLRIMDILKRSKFDNFQIKIPIGENTSERSSDQALTYEEFIKIDRNYKGIILIAKNENEEIRVLFRNKGKANFFDDIFPSIESVNEYNIYVSSNDPLRVKDLAEFIKTTVEEYKTSKIAAWIAYIIMFLGLGLPIIIPQSLNLSGISPLIVAVGIVILLFISILISTKLVNRILPRTGLYMFEPKTIDESPIWLQEFKRQWLVILVSNVFGFIVGLGVGTLVGK